MPRAPTTACLLSPPLSPGVFCASPPQAHPHRLAGPPPHPALQAPPSPPPPPAAAASQAPLLTACTPPTSLLCGKNASRAYTGTTAADTAPNTAPALTPSNDGAAPAAAAAVTEPKAAAEWAAACARSLQRPARNQTHRACAYGCHQARRVGQADAGAGHRHKRRVRVRVRLCGRHGHKGRGTSRTHLRSKTNLRSEDDVPVPHAQAARRAGVAPPHRCCCAVRLPFAAVVGPTQRPSSA